MVFEDYVSTLPSTLSDVKRKILERLWLEGVAFPRGWVLSTELLELTDQKYFDRRVRELRDNVGCDIETGMFDGAHAYRLLSTNVKSANPRGYLTETQKKALFQSNGHVCAICGQKFASGLRGLQADHKVPLNREGSHDTSNWQPLCVECNVGKRRACAGCELNCQTCSWAFPEKIGRRVIIQIPLEIESAISTYAINTGKSTEMCVAEALFEYVARRCT